MDNISAALSAGACLVDSSAPSSAPDLKSILVARLTKYYAHLTSVPVPFNSYSLDDLQLRTAQEALAVVTRVQHIVQGDATNSPDDPSNPPPLLGARDLAEIRTLLSIVANWGVLPLLARIRIAFQSRSSIHDPAIIDLTATAETYEFLKAMASNILNLLFPWGPKLKVAQTHITTTILDKHMTELLTCCLLLGWVPKSLSSDVIKNLDIARVLTGRILNILPPSQAISALGPILSQPNPSYVRKSCAFFLTRQLLRPEGVRGLCTAVFGEGHEASNEDTPINKLEDIARVLTTVPATIQPLEYFNLIIPRLVDMLSPQEPLKNMRAASFTISRILSIDSEIVHRELAANMLLNIFHSPFLTFSSKHTSTQDNPSFLLARSPSSTLPMLITLVSNADPSPALLSTLLSPIISSLYSLLHHMDKIKTVDPSLKESLHSMLVSWARIIDQSKGVSILWSLIGNEDGHWSISSDGFQRTQSPDPSTSLSLLTPKDMQAVEGELDINLFDLYPNPIHFVKFLIEVGRPDITSDFFAILLQGFQDEKAKGNESDPVRILLLLQIIMQMQVIVTQGQSDLFSKPAQILGFIRYVLESSHNPTDAGRNADVQDSDSDDDTPGASIVTPDSEMIETALSLLHSVMEANESLSARSEPVLNDIFDLLEPLARGGPDALRPLASQARMTMTARLALSPTSTSHLRSREDDQSDQAIYQKALKMLQDPLLPVRAHGLLLLRQLVTPISINSTESKTVDSALVPAILSVFLQSVQDDDSYLFLNAVKGLATMVDAFGKDVLIALTKEYTYGLDGLGATNMTQREIDIRVRLGEALAMAIQRCGEALGAYVSVLVPPLLLVLRFKNVPTSLRISTISLLAECERTSSVALLPYVVDLFDAMIDVIQIESLPEKSRNSDRSKKATQPTMNELPPVSRDPELPALRRSATHFLLFVVRETIKQIYGAPFSTPVIPTRLLKRARITLAYAASTDEDNVLRIMARETSEELDQLARALIGV